MANKCPKCQTVNPDDSKFCKECAAPLPQAENVAFTKTLETPIEELTTGSTFAGRYQIIEELGKGGMGRVYKALDKETRERIALKLIKPQIASDKKTIERFRKELTFARKIRHKNVCAMYDLNREESSYYITMEYVSGGDLKKFIRRSKQLNVGTAISIGKQICEGLSEAHRLGIVHRDLKPNNIMIDDEGSARIMDFGIARTVKEKGITGSGVMIGTPEYMSPEQAEAKEVDQRSDIYSLGVILYEMTTGRLPFEGETSLAVAMKHKGEIPKDPKEFNPQIPEDLSAVILRCLEKERDQRYQTADDLLAELEKIEQGLPTTDRVVTKKKPLTSKEITVTFSAKNLIPPALFIIAITIAGLILWHPWSKKEMVPVSMEKPTIAVLYFENNTGDPALDYLKDGLSDLLITDLQQSKFIKVLSSVSIFSILRNCDLLEAEKLSLEDLRRVAGEGEVSHVLNGSFMTIGEKFIINYALLRADTGDVIRSLREEGAGIVSIQDSVDKISKKVRIELDLSPEQIANDIDRKLKNITTDSLEAYALYLEGKRLGYEEWKFDESLPFFKKAVEIDPEFAMGYRAIAAAYSNIGRISEWKRYLQKAYEFKDRLTLKERYLIEGDYYRNSEKAFDKSMKAYNQLIKFYPDDRIGYHALGQLYRLGLENWDKAIEQYMVNIQKNEKNPTSYTTTALCYRAKNMYEESKEILEFYRDNISDNPGIHLSLGVHYLCRNEFDLALVEADQIQSWDLRGDIFHCQDNFVEAEEEYKKGSEAAEVKLASLYLSQGKYRESIEQLTQHIDNGEISGNISDESMCHYLIGYRYLKLGDIDPAIEECNKALNAAFRDDKQQRRNQYLLGLCYIRKGLTVESQKMAERLNRDIIVGMTDKQARYSLLLSGLIEMAKENYSRAIEMFQEAISLLPYQHQNIFLYNRNDQALFFEPLAFALYKTGNLEKAQEDYERITRLTTGRLFYGDIYAKSFDMLGKIHEKQGDTAKAIEHYEKFLDLWKDADSGIAEVEDARNSLRRIRNSL